MAGETTRDTGAEARERFLRLHADGRRLDVHIGVVHGSRYVWVATLHEPIGELQMIWLTTMLPWGTHLRMPTGLMVRVHAPSDTAAFWGEFVRGRRDLADAASRLHARRSETQMRHAGASPKSTRRR